MTNRWINYLLTVVVWLGLVGAAIYQRPRLAQERAEFLDQDVVEREAEPPAEIANDGPLDLRHLPGMQRREGALGVYGVSAGAVEAVDIGMAVLEHGGNAVDAAIAVAYALGVAEPFGSGPGGGGTALIHAPGEAPRAYDYREMAPQSGEVPPSRTGAPGFVAGMEHLHAQHGTIELADLIEPAVRLADGGVVVTDTLQERLEGAAHRLPIHLLPELFPEGVPIRAGETLVQPAYAQALRTLQEEGAAAFYEGALGEELVAEVSGLNMSDLAAYEVLELAPAVGRFGDYEVVSAPPAASGPTLVQMLQVLDALDIGDRDPDGPDTYHLIAQSWRVALSDRTEFVADETIEDIDLDVAQRHGEFVERPSLR
jgi:gamma-glutamyltranspeptidase / glutathione hydrolase